VQPLFAEADYDGPLAKAPAPDTQDHAEWAYAMQKRQAEDVLAQAWEDRRFPFTALRLPLVISEWGHSDGIYGYLLRLWDDGPIVIPALPQPLLRPVYGEDVVNAILVLINTGFGKGRAYNISQDETLTLEDFLALLAGLAGCELQLISVKAHRLDSRTFLRNCSPFSHPWTPALDNRRSKAELGHQSAPLTVCLRRCHQRQSSAAPQQLRYTPLVVYLQRLIAYFEGHRPPPPASYRQRRDELDITRQAGVYSEAAPRRGFFRPSKAKTR
jgi:nucleoside-diphosphate-sugar epimerase